MSVIRTFAEDIVEILELSANIVESPVPSENILVSVVCILLEPVEVLAVD